MVPSNLILQNRFVLFFIFVQTSRDICILAHYHPPPFVLGLEGGASTICPIIHHTAAAGGAGGHGERGGGGGGEACLVIEM